MHDVNYDMAIAVVITMGLIYKRQS